MNRSCPGARSGGSPFALAASALVTLINPYGWRLYAEIFASLSDRFMIPGVARVAAGLSPEPRRACLRRLCARTRLDRLLLLSPGRTGSFGPSSLSFSASPWNIGGMCRSFSSSACRVCAEQVAAVAERAARFAPAGFTAQGLAVGRDGRRGPHDGAGRAGTSPAGGAPRDSIPASSSARPTIPLRRCSGCKRIAIRWGTRLYNDYGYGGFLLWWLPEERIFIDGRMPAWRIGDRWIFYDYVALTNWGPSGAGRARQVQGRLGARSPREPAGPSPFGARAGWRPVYEDAKAVIYVRR
ncbi:MAG: hypothetical protein KatS3mg082_1256 [Nitrospiraceae bacterium]|nr:MAG: hypothetical protein KatS3mg082_1256 [Nitrospiraceae bacterium]